MVAPVPLISVLAFLLHSKMGRDESRILILWQKYVEQEEEGQTSGKTQEKLALFPLRCPAQEVKSLFLTPLSPPKLPGGCFCCSHHHRKEKPSRKCHCSLKWTLWFSSSRELKEKHRPGSQTTSQAWNTNSEASQLRDKRGWWELRQPNLWNEPALPERKPRNPGYS